VGLVVKRAQVLSSIIAIIFVISLVSVITQPVGAVSTPIPFDINIFKFNDLNGNGVQDPGEPPLAGVQFTVKDSSASCGGSGSTTGCGAQMCSGTTDSNGNFVCHIPDTTVTTPPYVVTEVQPSGFVSTTLAPGPITPGSSPSVNLVFGDKHQTVITSPTQGEIFTTGAVTITGFTDPVNTVNVYWDTCNDNCLVLLGSPSVDPTSGAWTITPIIPFPHNPITTVVVKALHGGIVVDSATVSFGIQTSTMPGGVSITDNLRGTTFDGLPIVYWGSSTTFTINGPNLCGGTNPTSINLDIGPFSDTPELGIVSMAMTQEVSDPTMWTATFGPFLPHHGIATTTFTPVCPTPPPTIVTFDIYVDPSGTISNACTGLPISGATTTLLVDSGGGVFVPATAHSPPIIPAINPETTIADGMFGWEAIPGTYEVTAASTGYVSQTTPPVTIPPAVTGLNIHLTPIGGCTTSIPEFPFSFNLVIIFVVIAAVYMVIRQKMTTNLKPY
jgi:hypothetical protein